MAPRNLSRRFVGPIALMFSILFLYWPMLSAAEIAVFEPLEPISGSLVIHGGGSLSDSVLEGFVKLAGGAEARIVVIPTAIEKDDAIEEAKEIAPFIKRGAAGAVMLHTRSRGKADEAAFCECLKTATGVWFGGGQQSNLEKVYVGTRVETALHELLKRGGVIGGTSAGAAAMSRVMIRSGNPKAEVGRGFGFLPGVVIDQHFIKRDRAERLKTVLSDHAGLAGLGIDEGTALIVRGRQMGVLGDSTVSVCFAASVNRPLRVENLKHGEMYDLVALRRAAIARAGTAFPPNVLPSPEVDGKGTLVIDGGGLPAEALLRFIKAAGGADALIAVIPTAQGDDPPAQPGEARLLRKAGATNLKIIHARNPAEANAAQLLAVLKEAKGIWFCGGRQWRLVDSFLDTPAEKLMHDVLARGGAIGGSSAGATIQAEYLVRGNPLGNREMMFEGYERGMGFLKGVAIDQHFTQRNRFADMTLLKQAFPQLVGLGIDENAALIVTGHVMEVVGTTNVNVYDRTGPAAPGQADYEVIKPGEKYDFKTRQRLEAARP